LYNRGLRWQYAALFGLFAPRWRRARLEAFQDARVRALIHHSYRNVPYYRRLFDKAGLQPEDIRTIADLAKIPPSSRAAFQSVPPRDLIARGCNPERLVVHRTSGSTGEPFNILRTAFEDRLLQAYRLAVLFRFGMRLDDRRAAVVTRKFTRWPLYMRAGLLRYEEIHCLQEPDEILARLRQACPDVLRGFPGTLAFLAGIMTGADRERIRPRFITTDSETLTPAMRSMIEAGFGAKVIDFYDSHEFNLIAAECPVTGLYHVSDASLVGEVVSHGLPARPGEEGEFIGTALQSWAMPFIRFSLGDLVTRGPESCPCGAQNSVLAGITGRVANRFQLPDGRSLHPYALVNPLLAHGAWVRQYQIVQVRENLVHVKLAPLPGANPSPEAVAAVGQLLRDKLGPGVAVEVVLVDRIPAARNGKYRPYYSLLPGTGAATQTESTVGPAETIR